ncbi:MAG: alpha/beta fold hydrolase [Minisyncoccia bacterium]
MQEYFYKDIVYYRKNEFRPDRLTIVFVHGVSGSSSAWWPFEKILQNKYNILTYDIRGHGMSKKYPRYEDYEVKNFAKDLQDLLSFLHVSKFILLSSSFGTLIAREYLKQNRDKVLALIFTSTEEYEKGALLLKIVRPLLKILTGLLKLLPFNPKPRGHVDYSKIKNSDWSIQRNYADMRNTGLHAHLYTLRQSFLPEQEYDLAEINVPTLIIHGEKDSLVPIKNARAFAQKIKISEFVSIPNFDHDIHHNAAPAMCKAIEAFIERHRSEFQFS